MRVEVELPWTLLHKSGGGMGKGRNLSEVELHFYVVSTLLKTILVC